MGAGKTSENRAGCMGTNFPIVLSFAAEFYGSCLFRKKLSQCAAYALALVQPDTSLFVLIKVARIKHAETK
jgi:hypothetical protein